MIAESVAFAPGEFPLLLAYAALAIYACVPETDQMPTVGWMIAGLLLIERVTRSRSALVVDALAGGIVLWSGLYGASGRGSAIVGAWFAFWPLVLAIGSTLLVRPLSKSRRWVIGLIGGLAAIAVARTGGIEPTTAPALIAVAIAVPVSMTAAVLAGMLGVQRDAARTQV